MNELDKDIDEMQAKIEGRCDHCGVPPKSRHVRFDGSSYEHPTLWDNHDESCPVYVDGLREWSSRPGQGG
jgi:hypothetical protein